MRSRTGQPYIKLNAWAKESYIPAEVVEGVGNRDAGSVCVASERFGLESATSRNPSGPRSSAARRLHQDKNDLSESEEPPHQCHDLLYWSSRLVDSPINAESLEVQFLQCPGESAAAAANLQDDSTAIILLSLFLSLWLRARDDDRAVAPRPVAAPLRYLR
jgi:hypothetical protein